MSESKDRLNFRMKPATAEKLEHWYKADHCRSKNEFVEKAVNFYADSLAAENSTTLPLAIQTTIDSRLKLLEDRMASILYKQTVETDMAISILLQSVNVDEAVLRQERAKSIMEVKRTNGRLRMEQISGGTGQRRYKSIIRGSNVAIRASSIDDGAITPAQADYLRQKYLWR